MTADFYQRAILSLAREEIGKGLLDPNDGLAMLDNPVCGDRATMSFRLEDGRIAEIGHRIRGCILCESTASVIAKSAPGMSPAEFADLAAAFEAMIRQAAPAPALWPDLTLFEPVRNAKSRHECVLLPFGALTRALRQADASQPI